MNPKQIARMMYSAYNIHTEKQQPNHYRMRFAFRERRSNTTTHFWVTTPAVRSLIHILFSSQVEDQKILPNSLSTLKRLNQQGFDSFRRSLRYIYPLRCIFEWWGACQQKQRQNISCPVRKMLIYSQFTKYRGRSRRSTRQNSIGIPAPVFRRISVGISEILALVRLLLHCFCSVPEVGLLVLRFDSSQSHPRNMKNHWTQN